MPDDLDAPVALIDVKDLAAWIAHCIDQQILGTFNATGPTITLGEALASARRSAASEVAMTPVAPELLLEAGVNPWMGPESLPWWIPHPEMRYSSTANSKRSRAHGLTTRPLEETLADALEYECSRGGPLGSDPRGASSDASTISSGLSFETERRIRRRL